MWDESELIALSESSATTTTIVAAASKPAFSSEDEEDESDEAPDPAYIYDPNSVRRRAVHRSSQDEGAPDYRLRQRRARAAGETDDGN